MKMSITDDMIDGFNDVLKDRNSLLRIKRTDRGNSVEVILIDEDLLSSYIINLNEEFYSLLESFFKDNCSIENLSYNNTGTTFWKFG